MKIEHINALATEALELAAQMTDARRLGARGINIHIELLGDRAIPARTQTAIGQCLNRMLGIAMNAAEDGDFGPPDLSSPINGGKRG